MEDHNEQRKICDPETYKLQQILIIDFIQKVTCRDKFIEVTKNFPNFSRIANLKVISQLNTSEN